MGKFVPARQRVRFLRCWSVSPGYWNVSLVKTKKKVLAIAHVSTAASRGKDNNVGESLTLCLCGQTLTREHGHALRGLTVSTEAGLEASIWFVANKQQKRSFFHCFSSVNA